ncbi:MAG: hypothetical protein H7343_07130 [Undibacterium sp.]|nr:hypothetical protein [Opitutaceae bacterium]
MTAARGAEESPLLAGIVTKYGAVSLTNPADPDIAVRWTTNNAIGAQVNRTFAPSRSAQRLKSETAALAANPKNARAFAGRAQAWDGITEVFLEDNKTGRRDEALQYGHLFNVSRRDPWAMQDGPRRVTGLYDPFEVERDRDVRAAFALAPDDEATLAAILQVQSFSDYGPTWRGTPARRIETARELLGALQKAGHPEAALEQALLAAKVAMVYLLQGGPAMAEKYQAFEALAQPLLTAPGQRPLEGEPTSLTKLAIWFFAVRDCAGAAAPDDEGNRKARAGVDASIARAAAGFPNLMSEVALQVSRALRWRNAALCKKWLDLAVKTAGTRPHERLRVAQALVLPAGSDARHAVLAVDAFELTEGEYNRANYLVEVAMGAQKRKQPELARRAWAEALYHGAEFQNWADLARLDFAAGDFERAYRSNQVAMQTRKPPTLFYDIDLDRSPAAELGRWLTWRNAVLLALLEKGPLLPVQPDPEPAKTGGTVKTVVSRSMPQSQALYGALTGFDFGPPGKPDPVLLVALAETEKLQQAHPANERLKIDRDRLKWAVANQR